MSPAASTSGAPSAVSVASQARPLSSVRPLEASHSTLGIAPRATSTTSASSRVPSASSTPATRPAPSPTAPDALAQAQVDAVGALQRGGALADQVAQRGHRQRRDVAQRDVDAERAGARRDLAADEARADDQQPRRAVAERLAQRDRVADLADRVHPVQLGAGPAPRPRPAAGGDDQAVVVERSSPSATVCAVDVQRRRALAQAPVHVEVAGRGTGGRRPCARRWSAAPWTAAGACRAGAAPRPRPPPRPRARRCARRWAARSPASDAPTMTSRDTISPPGGWPSSGRR